MKKVLMMAAAAAMLFAGCAKENGTTIDKVVEGELTIRIANNNLGTATRTVEAGSTGAAGEITLGDMYVIVAKAGGVIRNGKSVTAADMTAGGVNGVKLDGQYASSDKVLVLANLTPAQKTYLETFAVLDADVQDVLDNVQSINEQTNFKTVLLGNKNSALDANTALTTADFVSPVATGTPGQLQANVTVMPMVSRVELGAVTAAVNSVDTDSDGVADYSIKSFSVSGVFINNFYPSFTFGGVGSGTMFSLAEPFAPAALTTMAATYPTYYDNVSPAGASVAIAGGFAEYKNAGGVFGYNVVSKGTPYVAIRLTNIVCNDASGALAATQPFAPADTKFIVISGFEDAATDTKITNFERGNVYRIGVTGKLNFTVNNIQDTPIPSPTQSLNVKVDVQEWKAVDTNPIME